MIILLPKYSQKICHSWPPVVSIWFDWISIHIYLVMGQTSCRKDGDFLSSGDTVHTVDSRDTSLDHLLGVDTRPGVDGHTYGMHRRWFKKKLKQSSKERHILKNQGWMILLTNQFIEACNHNYISSLCVTIHIWTHNMRGLNNSSFDSQYHSCWCPGSLCRQDISTHDIDYIEQVSSCLAWGRISTTCVMSVWRNYINCRYVFVFIRKNLLCEGFIECYLLMPCGVGHLGKHWIMQWLDTWGQAITWTNADLLSFRYSGRNWRNLNGTKTLLMKKKKLMFSTKLLPFWSGLCK